MTLVTANETRGVRRIMAISGGTGFILAIAASRLLLHAHSAAESGRVCQRVLMIANMLEGMEHEEAARLAGLSRSAAYEWHNRYEEDGIEGLRDRPRPGRQPRVDAVTSARFKERIVAGAELERDGVVAFRAVDAQRILKEEFAIDCSLSSTYRLLHRIKLSWLAPRPRHPQADATAQAAFSQLLDCN